MSEYCQDRAILWLSRSFTAASDELREVCVEMAFLYEQMARLSDHMDRMTEALDQGRTLPPNGPPRL